MKSNSQIIRPRADAVPTAVPRIPVWKNSGALPYKIALKALYIKRGGSGGEVSTHNRPRTAVSMTHLEEVLERVQRYISA